MSATGELAQGMVEIPSGVESDLQFRPIAARTLLHEFPHLRAPIVDGVLRQGETLNVIAPSKTGKTWLVLDLALAVATGRPWLGFATHPGRVLVVDNELHRETLAHRLPKVADARGITIAEYGDHLELWPVRGEHVNTAPAGRLVCQCTATTLPTYCLRCSV